MCAEMCSHDSDCPNDEKCCSNGCGHQCTALSIGILYKCTGHIFRHYSDSFSDLVSVYLYNRKAWSVSEEILWSRILC